MNVIFEAAGEKEGGGQRVGRGGREREGVGLGGWPGEESILQRWQMCPHARESI